MTLTKYLQCTRLLSTIQKSGQLFGHLDKSGGNDTLKRSFVIISRRLRRPPSDISSIYNNKSHPFHSMGALQSTLTSTIQGHVVAHVKTGDRKNAGTDANVWLVIHDASGNSSKETKLNSVFHNDHERGQTTSYKIPEANHLDQIVKVEFWRDNFGLGDDWYLDIIHVENKKTGQVHYFPIQRWIKPNMKYVFPEFDTCLPQFDIHRDQRDEELKEKRKSYDYVMHVKDGPSQVKKKVFFNFLTFRKVKGYGLVKLRVHTLVLH